MEVRPQFKPTHVCTDFTPARQYPGDTTHPFTESQAIQPRPARIQGQQLPQSEAVQPLCWWQMQLEYSKRWPKRWPKQCCCQLEMSQS
jgi:hypothetical protein